MRRKVTIDNPDFPPSRSSVGRGVRTVDKFLRHPLSTASDSYLPAGTQGRVQLSTFVVVFILIATPLVMSAQDVEKRDTIPTNRLDSIGKVNGEEVVKIKSYADRFDPQKALLYSAILPGLGQVYNNSAWKVPIVWGGFVAFGYGIKYYHDGYVLYKDLLYEVLNDPSLPSILPVQTLRHRVNRYQRDRDFTVMLTGVWYILQMVEAHVDAHLKEFKVNPQLDVMVEPAIESNYLTGRTNGLSLKLRF